MKKDLKGMTVRLDEETSNKLRYISEYNGRSGNRQIRFLINKAIREFEEEHGKIELSENEN